MSRDRIRSRTRCRPSRWLTACTKLKKMGQCCLNDLLGSRFDLLILEVPQLDSLRIVGLTIFRKIHTTSSECSANHCRSSISISHCSAVSGLNQRPHTPNTNSHLRATRSTAPLEQTTTSHHTSLPSCHSPNGNNFFRVSVNNLLNG